MIKLINKLFYLADEAPKSDTNLLKHFRGRVHLAMLIMLNACLTPLAAYILVSRIFFSGSIQAQSVLVILIVLISIYTAAGLAIVYTGMTDTIGYFTTIWSSLILFSVIAINSGIPSSEVLPLIVVPIGMGFCFLGYRAGTTLGLLCLILIFLMGSLKAKGINFPDLINTDIEFTLRSYVWLMSFVFLIGTFTCYEWIISRITQSRGNIYNDIRQKAYQIPLYENALIDKTSFSVMLETAMERSQNYQNKFLLIHIHLNKEDKNHLLKAGFNACIPTIRKVDSIVRIDESCFCIIVENIPNEDNVSYFLQHIKRQLNILDKDCWEIDYIICPNHATFFNQLIHQCSSFGKGYNGVNHV